MDRPEQGIAQGVGGGTGRDMLVAQQQLHGQTTRGPLRSGLVAQLDAGQVVVPVAEASSHDDALAHGCLDRLHTALRHAISLWLGCRGALLVDRPCLHHLLNLAHDHLALVGVGLESRAADAEDVL